MLPRPPQALALALLLLCAACGGADPAVEASQRALARGDLERAAKELSGASGPAADELMVELEARLAAHAAFEAELERLAALDPTAEAEGLDALEERADDAALVERLGIARSSAADRAAEWRSGAGARQREIERQEDRRRERQAVADARAQEETDRLRGEEEARIREQRAQEVRERRAAGRARREAEAGARPTGPGAPVAAVGGSASPEAPARSVSPEPSRSESSRPVVTPEPREAPADEPVVTELEVLRPALEREERDLTRARADRRDEAAAALLERGLVAEPFLKRAIEARWAEALEEVVDSSTLKSLAKVAQDREELDHRRQEALELIFDEDEYFYPYRPPECPPEKARLYWPVQRRVDELVNEVRAVWDRKSRAKIAADYREAVAELAWCQEQQQHCTLVLDLSLPAELPEYALLVGPEEGALELRDFCWDEQEHAARAYDRAVRARNLALWAKEPQEERPEEQRAAADEQRQVEITNDYRQLFGRRRLAWNPLLQAATDMHSSYMAETGNFGHYEEDRPDRRTPFDRMRLCGYVMGISENCHRGGGGAEGAHNGWTHSSGHHRNLLMPGHREMATANNSGFWTQNFGTDTTFTTELE